MGKTSGNQKVTTTTKLPDWYDTAAQSAIATARQAANNLAMPYQQNTVAGIDPITANAVNLTGQNVGSSNAAFQSAQQGATGVMGYDPTMIDGGSFLNMNVGQYMNPYIQNVEDRALANMDRAYRNNLNTIGDAATHAHAFGGSRQGVAEGVAAAENARQMGDLSAQLRQSGYDNATNLMGQDLQRAYGAAQSNQNAGLQGAQVNLAGANSLGSLAAQQQQEYLRSLQSAISAGQINQQQAQALLTQAQDQYNLMRQYPTEQLNIMLSALGGTQVPTSSTTKTPTSGNFLTGAAGGALAGMSMGPWGALAGGILGGISSL